VVDEREGIALGRAAAYQQRLPTRFTGRIGGRRSFAKCQQEGLSNHGALRALSLARHVTDATIKILWHTNTQHG
jgi:hypothetical protein